MHLRPASVYVCNATTQPDAGAAPFESRFLRDVRARVALSDIPQRPACAPPVWRAPRQEQALGLDQESVYQTSLADQFEDLSEPVLQKAL